MPPAIGESAASCACATGARPRWPREAFPLVWLPARWTRWPSTIAMPWVSRANERAAALRERGWANASVLGVSEQGGHHVVQVMKYGAAGSMHEALASTGEVEWLDAAKMAGPVSVGVLGLAAAGAVAGLVSESRKQRVAETEAAAASVAAFNPCLTTRALKAGGRRWRCARGRGRDRSSGRLAPPQRPAFQEGRHTGRRRGCCSGRRTGGGVPLVQRRCCERR